MSTQDKRFVAVPPPPSQAWAGLALPGLGHLLTGQILDAFGLMSLSVLIDPFQQRANHPRLLALAILDHMQGPRLIHHRHTEGIRVVRQS